MSQVIIQNSTRPLPQTICARYCRTFISKFLGYMFRPEIAGQEGILLVERRDSRMDTAIHMLFMRFDLAVIWINSDLTVVDARLARKWQPVVIPARPARYVLETHPEQLANFNIGDRVDFVHD